MYERIFSILSEFSNFMRKTKSQEHLVVCKQLIEFFKHMKGWDSDSDEEFEEFSYEKLLKSGYLDKKQEETVDQIDW